MLCNRASLRIEQLFDLIGDLRGRTRSLKVLRLHQSDYPTHRVCHKDVYVAKILTVRVGHPSSIRLLQPRTYNSPWPGGDSCRPRLKARTCHLLNPRNIFLHQLGAGLISAAGEGRYPVGRTRFNSSYSEYRVIEVGRG